MLQSHRFATLLALALAGSATGAEEPSQALPFLILVPGLDSQDEASPLEVFAWTENAWVAAQWRGEVFAGGSRIAIPMGCLEGGRYAIRQGSTASLAIAPRPPCAEPVRADLRPAARLFGRFVPPEGSLLPRAGKLQPLDCRESEGWPALAPTESFPVSVDDEGRWEVMIPGECGSARLTVGDFTPIFVERLGLTVPGKRDLGTERLSYAAVVLLRAVRSPSGLPLAGATVQVVAEDEVADVARRIFAGRQYNSPSHSKTDGEGWARLGDLPSGLFHLLITSAASPPYFSPSFELRAQTEAFLGDVEIPDPAALTVRLDVSAGLLAELAGFSLHLQPVGTEHWMERVLLQARAGDDGAARLQALPPGTWNVTAIAIDARGEQYPAGSVEVELLPGSDQEITLASAIAALSGEVQYRGSPLEASISFWPLQRDGRPPVYTATHRDGTFELLLAPGEYRVQVMAVDGSAQGHIPVVTFEESGDYLKLELPEGEIRGVVIASDGTPASGARIEANRLGSSRRGGNDEMSPLDHLASFGRCDAAGRFALTGLPEGTWYVSATAGEEESTPVEMELLEGQSAPPMVIRLELQYVLRGTVLSASGTPVEGAVGRVTAWPSGAALPEIGELVTGKDGGFTVKLKRTRVGDTVNLEIASSSLPSLASRIALPDRLDVQLPETALGGIVEVAAELTAVSTNSLILVDETGAFLVVSTLLSSGRATISPTLLTLSGMRAGRWSLLQVASSGGWRELVAGQGNSLPRLASFVASPATVSIAIDK